jgi:unsaturated chondroitin disaccharide hydrolase
VTPLGYKINGAIGYADSSTTIDNWTKMSVIVRTNPDGYFDAINGAAYAAQANVPYIANCRYHVRIVVDLGTRTYDVFITPPNGTETLLANDYVFRSGSPSMSNIGKLLLHTDNNDELLVENHKVY